MADAQPEHSRRAPAGALASLTRPLAIAGGALLLAVAAMVMVSVVMRWLTSYSITGDIELVQIATALAVFAFFPMCQSVRGNIMVDTFTGWLPPRLRDGLDALWDVVYAGAALVIAWGLAQGAADTLRSHTVSMMLSLPIGWAIAACSAMAGFLALVAFATALRLMRGAR